MHPKWRVKLLRRLDVALVVFELTLSVVFLLISYFVKSQYLRGVGVGLMIAWVTGAIAYAIKARALSTS